MNDTVKVAKVSNQRRNSISAAVILVALLVLASASYATWKYVVAEPGQSVASNSVAAEVQPQQSDYDSTVAAIETDADAGQVFIAEVETEESGFVASQYPESPVDEQADDLDLQNEVDDWVPGPANNDYYADDVADVDADSNDLPVEESMPLPATAVGATLVAENTTETFRPMAPADSGSVGDGKSMQIASTAERTPQVATAVQVGSGVALVSIGEVLLADSAADYVRKTLSRYNIEVIDGMSIPGVADRLAGNGGEIQSLIRPRARYLIYIRADYTSERQLYFMGRADVELQSRLNMETHDLLDGRSVGDGIHATVGYTAMSVADKVQELLRPGFAPVASQLSE